jgi:hypothetical protein
MTWHTEIIRKDDLSALLGTIRSTGGTITSSRPCPSGYSVTYVTLDDRTLNQAAGR